MSQYFDDDDDWTESDESDYEDSDDSWHSSCSESRDKSDSDWSEDKTESHTKLRKYRKLKIVEDLKPQLVYPTKVHALKPAANYQEAISQIKANMALYNPPALNQAVLVRSLNQPLIFNSVVDSVVNHLAVFQPEALAKTPRTVFPKYLTEHLPLIEKMKQKTTVTDTSSVDLLEVYKAVVKTRTTPLVDIKDELYRALLVKSRNPIENHDNKNVLNNVNYKIKNLLISFPHLRYYGQPRDFTIKTLNVVPEILVRVGDAELKKKFANLPKKPKRIHDLPD